MAWNFATISFDDLLANLQTLLSQAQLDFLSWGGNPNSNGYGTTAQAFVGFLPGALIGTNYTVTGASYSSGGGGTITYNFAAGTFQIQPNQVVSITGASPTGYNFTLVKVVSSTTTSITIAASANPGTWTSGGTILVGGIAAQAGMQQSDPNGRLWVYDGIYWGVCTPIYTLPVTLTNGSNENINIGNASCISVTGPTATFALGGFTGGYAGRRLTVINNVNQIMTVNYEDSGSSVGNRIFIPSLANFSSAHSYSTLEFVWDSLNNLWRLLAPASN